MSPAYFPVQDNGFMVPSLTSLNSASTTVVNFTVAVSSGKAPRAQIRAPVPQQGTLSPKVVSFDNLKVANTRKRSGYSIWSGSVDIGALVTGVVAVSVLDAAGRRLTSLSFEQEPSDRAHFSYYIRYRFQIGRPCINIFANSRISGNCPSRIWILSFGITSHANLGRFSCMLGPGEVCQRSCQE